MYLILSCLTQSSGRSPEYISVANMDTILLVSFAFGAFCLILFGFRLLFKPKHFPPGPVSLPFIGGIYALGSKPYKKLTDLKKNYGNIIGMDFGSFPTIVLNDTETMKKAYSLPVFQDRPKFEFEYINRGKKPTGLLWASARIHDEQRSFVVKNLKAFGLNRKTMEILLMDQLGRLFNVLDTQLGKPIVNEDLFNTTAVGALWTMISSEVVNEEDEELKLILKLTKTMAKSFNTIVCFLPAVAKMFASSSGWDDIVGSNVHMKNYVEKKIEAHKNSQTLGEESRDLMDSFIRKVDSTTDKNSTLFGDLGKESIMNNICDLLLAGTETVSTVLTWFLSIMIRHPETQIKMQKEIDNVIGTKTPCLADRSGLPYIEATILEVLRFSVVLPLGFPHSMSEDVHFNGFYIPKDTVVMLNIYNTLRDPALWSEPDVFKPERFLNEDRSEILRNISKNVDWIFGYGKRMCPGERLAKDELFLVITGLCQRYNFKPDPNCTYEDEIDAHLGATLVPKPHTLIILKRDHV